MTSINQNITEIHGALEASRKVKLRNDLQIFTYEITTVKIPVLDKEQLIQEHSARIASNIYDLNSP